MKAATHMILILGILSFGISNASTLERYIKACVDNPKNGMGQALCECMGREAERRFNDDEFGFLYASAAKDAAAISKYNMTLGPQQKMNVIMYSMKGPSECAGKLGTQRKKPAQSNSGGSASSASSAAEDASR
ncbi:MAG: hypothetical protein KZQ93_11820 [Candidatus Thiodiazotropha sp. (ex Monitilora ramsayi)]|nr:hypothetical protein [Candidatus Thiodiazotropha sp. (ex Monitilora ramsayi)]